MVEKTYWYRYEDIKYAAGLNEFDEPIGLGRSAVRLAKLEVLSETLKGVWLKYPYNHLGKRYVRREATKRFACPTLEEAKDSFIARKKRQIRILEAKLSHIEKVLGIAENGGIREDGEIVYDVLGMFKVAPSDDHKKPS